jgi:hypothetical protein
MSGSAAADPWGAFRVPAAPAADARPADDPWGAFRQVAVPEGEPMPAAPQRTVGEQALRGVGLGLRDVVEGAAALPGMAVDALTYPVRAAGRALGYQMEAPTTLLSQGLTAAGLPVAETGGEQMVSSGVRGAASALPTLGAGLALQGARAAPSLANALAGGPVGQVVGGATGEMAATGARQNELGPVAELGAGLLGGAAGAGAVGLGRAGWEAGRAMGTPFFESGRQRMTADVLLRGSSNPETLAARLEAGADPALRLPGSPVTTAQQARDSGLLPIEQGMRTDVVGTGTPGGISPAARFREIEAQRNAVRTNALLDLGDGSSPDARGVAVRGNPAASGEPGFGLAGAEQTRRAAVSRAYEAIDPEGTSNLPLGPVRAAAAEAEAKYFGELSGDMPGALRSAIEDLGAAGDAVPWRSMQGLRQRLGEIAGNPDPTQARAAAAARQIRQSIDDTAERAAMPQELPSRPIGPDDIDAGYAAEGAAQHPDIAARLNMPEEQLAARLDAEPGPEGLSLVQYLRRRGGVQNQNDELRTVMGTTRAMPALISGRGLTLDRAAQAAWEAGYLGPKGTTYTPRELLDAVDAELRGLETRYPNGAVRARDNTRAATVADDLDREVAARGGNYDPRDPEATLRSLRDRPEDAPLVGPDAPDGFARLDGAFTPEQAQQWRAAGTARRELGQDFQRDTTGATAAGQILKRDQFGNPVLPDAKVASTALRSAADVRQVLRAAGDGADEVRAQLRGQFAEELAGRTRTTAVNQRNDRILAPAGFRKYLDAKAPVVAEIFEPEHVAQLDRLAADFAETSMANTVGRARGSDTAQNLSVGNFLARASNGLITPNNPLAQTVAGLGPVAKWLYAAPEAALREMFAEAMANPQFARDLLAKADPESVRRAAGYIETTLGERLKAAATTAATRQTVRSLNTEAMRPARENALGGARPQPAPLNPLLVR